MNNWKILRIKNAKRSGYYFYKIMNVWGDFQICISVPLRTPCMIKIYNFILIRLTAILDFWIIILKFAKRQLLPFGIYMFKVNNRNARTRCEICSKLTIKTLERHRYFYCKPWTGKCWLVCLTTPRSVLTLSKTIIGNRHKIHCLTSIP